MLCSQLFHVYTASWNTLLMLRSQLVHVLQVETRSWCSALNFFMYCKLKHALDAMLSTFSCTVSWNKLWKLLSKLSHVNSSMLWCYAPDIPFALSTRSWCYALTIFWVPQAKSFHRSHCQSFTTHHLSCEALSLFFDPRNVEDVRARFFEEKIMTAKTHGRRYHACVAIWIIIKKH